MSASAALPGRPRAAGRLARTPELAAALAARLTARDRWLLRMLHEHRVLTTTQIAGLAFGTTRAATARMSVLYTYRAVDRFRPLAPAGSAPLHFILDDAGAAVLAAEDGTSPAALGYRRDRAVAIALSARLGHTTGANGFFTELAADARASRGRHELECWWSERRCAAIWGDLARPDGYGRWTEQPPGRPPATADFFLEYDTGTEDLPRLIAKLAGYAALAARTGIPTPVLFWLPTARREAALRARLAGPPPHGTPGAASAAQIPGVPVATAAPGTEGPAGAAWLRAGTAGPRLPLAQLAAPGTHPAADRGSATISIAAGAAAVILLLAALIGGIAGVTGQQASACTAQPAASGAVSAIPASYLADYKNAGTQYGIPWTVLAGIGTVESDNGQSDAPGVHSGTNAFGAAGPMQFGVGGAARDTWGGAPVHPASQHTGGYGIDGDHDGTVDVYDPGDAIPSAAYFLQAHGAPGNMQAALFAWNHSSAYVSDVLGWAARYAAGGAPAISAPGSPLCQQAALGPLPPGTAGKVLAYAAAQLGKPYVFGATGPDAYDCSGLAMMAYRAAGLAIPRTSQEQWAYGRQIPASQVRPGDLVFFAGADGTPAAPGHVGIVVNPATDTMIDAYATGYGVEYDTYGLPASKGGLSPVVGFTRP